MHVAIVHPVTAGWVHDALHMRRYAEPANREFCTAITEWAFHERGVLRTSNLRHHRVGEADQPAAYRVSDQLEFSLVIEELVSGTWQPYQ